MTDLYQFSHNGYGLRATLESAGGSLKDWTVLSPQNDPFRLDTPANHRDGAWLADTMSRLGIDRIHNRGLHYALLTQPKPDGKPYTTTDWAWLIGVSNVARFLGYVPFDQIVDQKNDPPVVRLWRPPQPKGYVAMDFDIVLPDVADLTPQAKIREFTGTQPYHLALVGEKSSLDGVLRPVADRYRADLYLPSGDISNTMVYTLAKTAAEDGRPLIVLYFSDCDPSGWNMPIVVGHKLRAFKIQLFPQLEFRCYQACLTPDQVRQYDLPISPVKETEKRGDRWKEKMGVEQTEIDSIATLRPNLLRQIANDAIAPFYDHTLDDRVRQARTEWEQQAQRALDEQAGPHLGQLRADAIERIEEKRAEIDAILDDVWVGADDLELPPAVISEAQLDPNRVQPMPLCDSRWSFTEQTRRLIALKNYDTNGVGDA